MQLGERKWLFAVLTATMLWGCLGFFSRSLQDYGMGTMDIVTVRLVVCTIGLVVVLGIFRRDQLKVRRKDMIFFVLVGAAKFLCTATIFQAQTHGHIPLSLSTVLQMTSPYYVMVFAFFLFDEKITRTKVFSVCLAFLGCIIVSGVLTDDGAVRLVGVVLSLASALFLSINVIGAKVSIGKGYTPATYVLYSNLFAALISLPFADFGTIADTASGGIGPAADMLILGIGITMVPYFLEASSLKHLEAAEVSLVGMMEIVFASIVGYFAFGESMTAISFVGVLMIVASLAIMELHHNREHPKADVQPPRRPRDMYSSHLPP